MVDPQLLIITELSTFSGTTGTHCVLTLSSLHTHAHLHALSRLP